jgi:cold shock CspA family protein
MRPALRQGRVLWYDAARGYGFVHESDEAPVVFITKRSLDTFGVRGLEIVFDVVQGRASDRVNSIVLLRGQSQLH